MDNQALSELLNKDFSVIFRDVIQFRSFISSLAKIVGVDEFRAHMEFTKNQYYNRKNDPSRWSLDELQKAATFFQSHDLGNPN